MAESLNSQFALQDENEFQQLSTKCYYKIEIQHKYGLNITQLRQFNNRESLIWKRFLPLVLIKY